MDKFLIVMGAILLTVIIILPFAALGALVTMWAWNILVPAIFGLAKITFLQAWAVNILAGLFFRVTRISK